MSSRPSYFAKPTLAQVMRRPKWIGALFLALAVAAGFASLAQWQMGSAVLKEESKVDSENVYDLYEMTSPVAPVTDESAGRLASTQANIKKNDLVIVGNRLNFKDIGYWVVGHAVLNETEDHLAVTLGWAKDRATAEAFVDSWQGASNVELVGRYMPSEGIELPKPSEPVDTLVSLNTGQIINFWDGFETGSFSGYLVNLEAMPGLETIETHPPLPQEKINWLNLFYALEWLVFAGFAVFFWYRLAKDAWEKEHELKALIAKEQEALETKE